MTHSHSGLNDLQLSLMRLFNRPMSDEETLKLKRILVKNYPEELREEVQEIVKQKGYQQSDFDQMLNDPS